MQTRIRFTRYGHNTALGNFGPGDVAVCGESMARHLVEQVHCARFEQPKPVAEEAPQLVTKAPRRRKAAGHSAASAAA